MLVVFFTLTVFTLVLVLEVPKGCNGVVDNFTNVVIQTIHFTETTSRPKGLRMQCLLVAHTVHPRLSEPLWSGGCAKAFG